MKWSAGFLSAPAALSLVMAGAQGAGRPDVRGTLAVPAQVAPGAKASVVVEMTIAPGWHVNSHTPSDQFLIPTEVTLEASAGSLSGFRYPRDVSKRFSFSDKPLKVYEGTVRFEADLDLPATAAGEVLVHGNLSYQACNDLQCFPPAKIPLEARAAVSGGAKAH
jgi:DsbC/DsbD-like thiol-disulfide interchange protein